MSIVAVPTFTCCKGVTCPPCGVVIASSATCVSGTLFIWAPVFCTTCLAVCYPAQSLPPPRSCGHTHEVTNLDESSRFLRRLCRGVRKCAGECCWTQLPKGFERKRISHIMSRSPSFLRSLALLFNSWIPSVTRLPSQCEVPGQRLEDGELPAVISRSADDVFGITDLRADHFVRRGGSHFGSSSRPASGRMRPKSAIG